MEVRSDSSSQVKCDIIPAPVIPKTRLQVLFIWVCSSILLWTIVIQLVAVGQLWHPLLGGISNRISRATPVTLHVEEVVPLPQPLPPASVMRIVHIANVHNDFWAMIDKHEVLDLELDWVYFLLSVTLW